MATVRTTKRERACPHDSSEEIAIIRNSFIRHNAVLSAKHTNDITKKKDSSYHGIVTEVKAVGVAERSLASIKDKWQTLKKNVKDKVTSSVRIKRREGGNRQG